ncbi:MAG: 3-methyl-2-oxobutanoate dehydrogenase (2-methylpropanoyl-transferring) subunit alpha [Robiginitomaculum sp.]|nr:MAG: 3-methyl-2-oxobutanoate dehydrogenase (2-methylpropanoyl-transferring) subunit alpha [Robiginitomaculum sp.]
MTHAPSRNTSGFNVPEPASRPGDTPDFSGLNLTPSLDAVRPAPSCPAADTYELANALIGVLDDNHGARGAWNPQLPAKVLREGLHIMLKTRAYDDRMLKLQRQGKISFYMKSLGEEAVACAAGMALQPQDMLFPSYRQQGLLFARDRDMVAMMCHCLSNAKDNLKGRQLPIHYTWKEGNFFSISGNLGTQFPQAVGWAMASAARGEDTVTASWIGDGTTAEGDFHGACTLASVYQAPVILNVVNNQWAISSFSGIAGGQNATFAARGIGYGLASLRVDGNDFLAVYAVTQWAAARARAGHGSTLIEHVSYRADAHSTSDDPSRYRPKAEASAWPLGDPIDRLKTHLIALGEWDEERHAALQDALGKEVLVSYKKAESFGTLRDGPLSPVPSMFEDVFVEQPWHLRRQRQDLGV